jgi:hypothetical protein
MTPKEDFKQICDLTTNLLGLRKGSLAFKSRKDELQIARMIASVIGRKEGIKREVIADALNRHRTLLYYYEKMHKINFEYNYEAYAKAYTKVLSAYEEIEDCRKQFIDKFHLRHFVKELGIRNCEKKDIVFTIKSGTVSYEFFSDTHHFSKYYDILKSALGGYKATLNYKEYKDYKKLY